MTTAQLSHTDMRVRDAVIRQLEWDPEVDASAVGVSASKGAIILTGYIGTYAGKLAAERAAKRVRGVRAVANDINVRLISGRTDGDIAADVTRVLRLHSEIPEAVQASVKHGHVALTGHVPWQFQKREALKAVRHIRGVVEVKNLITIAPHAIDRDIRTRIEDALRRNANLDSEKVTVTIDGEHVTLSGTVATWLQRESAERAAADAPGVAFVHNRIHVEPVELLEGVVDPVC